MSECPKDSQWIRWTAGELAEPEHQALAEHLRACPLCRQRQAALRDTWDVLGQWEVTPPERDLSTAVLQAARESDPRRLWWPAVGRVAAAVLLAVTAGIAAGLLTPLQPQRPSVVAAGITADDVVEAVGLDVWAGGPDLAHLFMNESDLADLPEVSS